MAAVQADLKVARAQHAASDAAQRSDEEVNKLRRELDFMKKEKKGLVQRCTCADRDLASSMVSCLESTDRHNTCCTCLKVKAKGSLGPIWDHLELLYIEPPWHHLFFFITQCEDDTRDCCAACTAQGESAPEVCMLWSHAGFHRYPFITHVTRLSHCVYLKHNSASVHHA